MPSFRFEIPACPPAAVARLRRELGVSGALAQVLVRRGHGRAGARARVPGGRRGATRRAPSPGSATAVALIAAPRPRPATRITVHGDYDVDGVCSTAVLVRALRALGADVDHYLPDRAERRLRAAARRRCARLAARGTRLLVTADCAITAVEEVRGARALGMEVVVSDHHAPRADGALPDAPIVHPARVRLPVPRAVRDGGRPQARAGGAAAQAAGGPLDAERALERGLREDLDLVALATIADVVPLLGENRTLVRRGLRALAGTAKPGLRALMAVAGVDPARVDERAVGFALAPRLNAAGRLYRADAGLELLLTEDPARARADRAGARRRQPRAPPGRAAASACEAEAQMAALGERAAYVLAGEGWHPGVIGIVASRLVERSGRPVVLIALRGRARPRLRAQHRRLRPARRR